MKQKQISFSEYLICAAQKTPSADNIKPWFLEHQGCTLLVRYNREKKASENRPSATHTATLLAVGALLENLQQAAHEAQIPISMEVSSFEEFEMTGTYATVYVADFEKSVVEENLSHPLFKRKTNRSPYLKNRFTQLDEEDLNQLVWGMAKVKLLTNSQSIKKVGQQICKATELRFQTKECHQWLMGSLRFTESSAKEEGLNVKSLQIPKVGEWILQFLSPWKRMQVFNFFGGYHILAWVEAYRAKKTNTYLAFISNQDFKAQIRCGQAMERVWIELTRRGLSVHPYFVTTDMSIRLSSQQLAPKLLPKAQDITKEMNQLLQVNHNEMNAIIFRVGYERERGDI